MRDSMSYVGTALKCSENICSCGPTNSQSATPVKPQALEGANELFYTPVLVRGLCTLRGVLDSGSMCCTLSKTPEALLRVVNVPLGTQPVPESVVLVGWGGMTRKPKCVYE